MIGIVFENIAVLYRASLFSISGYNQFSRYGFLSNLEKFTPGAIDVDLKGKVAIVTGANAGLGKSVAMELAKRGATVHMLCRDQGRGQTARDEIVTATSNPNVILEVVDVSRPAQLKEFAEKFLKKSDAKVNILVNNAGILPNERKLTPDGLESTFATNTLGTYYLTKLLMPILEKTGNARVVSVSSGGMFNKKLDASDLQFEKGKFDGVLAYAQTKRQQVELTEKWAKDFPTVRFYSMHPGWADTVGVQTSIPTFHEYMKDRLRTPDQGADTIVWASIAEEANKVRNGAFLFDRKEVGQHLFLAGTTAPAGEIDRLVAACDSLIAKCLAI